MQQPTWFQSTSSLSGTQEIMFQRHLKFDVHCHWSETPPIYRIYVDNDMIVERTFGWPGYNVYIQENMVCDLAPGVHCVRIENCNESGDLQLLKLRVDNQEMPKQPGKDGYANKQWTFACNY